MGLAYENLDEATRRFMIEKLISMLKEEVYT